MIKRYKYAIFSWSWQRGSVWSAAEICWAFKLDNWGRVWVSQCWRLQSFVPGILRSVCEQKIYKIQPVHVTTEGQSQEIGPFRRLICDIYLFWYYDYAFLFEFWYEFLVINVDFWRILFFIFYVIKQDVLMRARRYSNILIYGHH